MFKALRHKLGLNRYTKETPNSQHQRSANKADMGVRPKPQVLPRRAAPSDASSMAPRQPVPTAGVAGPSDARVIPSPSASPAVVTPPTPSRSRTQATQPDAATADKRRTRATAAVQEVIDSQFGHVGQASFSKLALRHALQELTPPMANAAAQCLAAITGADASRSVAALAALRELNPVGDIIAAWRRRNEPGAEPLSEQHVDAWRVAMDLASTPIGMHVLQKIVGKPVAPEHESDFELLLKTASAIAKRTEPGTPATMLACATPPSTLLDHALACAAARLAGDAQAAQPHEWALNAVRDNAFDTDSDSQIADDLASSARVTGGFSPRTSPAAIAPTTQIDAEKADKSRAPAVVDSMKTTSVQGLVESQFGHVEQPQSSKLALRRALERLVPVMAQTAPFGLPGAPAVLVAQSLALATGADASRSIAALAALRELNPADDIAAAWHRAGESSSTVPPDQADAWRVAMDLATTPSGMRVLQAIVREPVAREQEENFRLLLKTASAIAERSDTPVTPASMLARATPPATLLDHALACAAARMAGDVQAAQPNDWALNAVRNDMLDDGPGSEFAAIEARLMKMGKWVDRATGKKGQPLYDPFRRKSAFRALRHGVQQVDRGPAIGRHRKAFDEALRSAAAELRDQFIQMAPFANAGGPAKVPRELFQAAVLDHCLADKDKLVDGRLFDDDAINDIATRLAGMLAEFGRPPADGDHESPLEELKKLPELKALACTHMSMEQLQAWLGDALKAHASLPGAWAEPRPRWADAVVEDLERAQIEVHGYDTRIPHVDREKVRDVLKHIVQNIEGSSRLRLTSGGVVGVGLRQVSAAVSSLVSGFLFRGRIDKRRQWGRQAVFEIAMPPYDMEIMVATQRAGAFQAGGGAFFGPDLGVFKAGANVDITAYGSEWADLQGVTLRLPRVGRPVSELRAEFSRLVDRLLDGTTAQARAGQQPLLKQLLQEFPELTVNRINRAGDKRTRHAATAEGTASLSCFGFRANASLGATIEGQHGVVRHYQDACGSMQVERHIAGWGVRGALGARLAAGPSADAGPVELSTGNTDTTIRGISADLLVAGGSQRREVVYQDGRLHPLSFQEHEFQNLDNFLHHMNTRREEWVQTRLAAAPARIADTEHATLQKFLDEVSDQATPTHTYAFRSTISREGAARVDAYRSAGVLAERQAARAGDSASSAALLGMRAAHEAVEKEWQTPESLKPYSLRAYERVLNQKISGLNVVAQVGALYAAEANHIDNRLDVA